MQSHRDTFRVLRLVWICFVATSISQKLRVSETASWFDQPSQFLVGVGQQFFVPAGSEEAKTNLTLIVGGIMGKQAEPVITITRKHTLEVVLVSNPTQYQLAYFGPYVQSLSFSLRLPLGDYIAQCHNKEGMNVRTHFSVLPAIPAFRAPVLTHYHAMHPRLWWEAAISAVGSSSWETGIDVLRIIASHTTDHSPLPPSPLSHFSSLCNPQQVQNAITTHTLALLTQRRAHAALQMAMTGFYAAQASASFHNKSTECVPPSTPAVMPEVIARRLEVIRRTKLNIVLSCDHLGLMAWIENLVVERMGIKSINLIPLVANGKYRANEIENDKVDMLWCIYPAVLCLGVPAMNNVPSLFLFHVPVLQDFLEGRKKGLNTSYDLPFVAHTINILRQHVDLIRIAVSNSFEKQFWHYTMNMSVPEFSTTIVQTKHHYLPTQGKILVGSYRGHYIHKMVAGNLIQLNSKLAHPLPLYYFEHELTQYDLRDLANYAAFVFVPYIVAQCVFLELYSLGVPVFMPSLAFLKRLHKDYFVVSELYKWDLNGSIPLHQHIRPPYSNEEASMDEWFPLMDYFVAAKFPHVQFFSSWPDLLGQLQSKDLASLSLRMFQDHKHHDVEQQERFSYLLVQVANHKLQQGVV